MENLTQNWLVWAVGIYLVGMVLYGHYRGFIRLTLSIAALTATLIIVKLGMPYVTDYLKNNTMIYENIQESMVKASGLYDADMAEEMPAEQRMIIESLNLPEQMKEILIENNNTEVYEFLGAERFADYIGRYLADMIISGAGFLIAFVVVFVAIQLVFRWLDLVAKLPILSGLNQIAGALMGGLEGLLFVWIFLLVLSWFSNLEWAQALMEQIEASAFLSFLYNNNLLNLIFAGIIKGIF